MNNSIARQIGDKLPPHYSCLPATDMEINSHRARRARAFETGGSMGQTTWFKEYISTHYPQACDVSTAFCRECAAQECSHPKGRQNEPKTFSFLSTSLQKLITVLSAFRKQQTLQADVHLNQGLWKSSSKRARRRWGGRLNAYSLSVGMCTFHSADTTHILLCALVYEHLQFS